MLPPELKIEVHLNWYYLINHQVDYNETWQDFFLLKLLINCLDSLHSGVLFMLSSNNSNASRYYLWLLLKTCIK